MLGPSATRGQGGPRSHQCSPSSTGPVSYNYLQIVLLQIIWSCLVEDSNLFFKYFMEQLTRDKSIETFQIVRKLIRFIPKLPQQAAFSLYNYIIGYIMFYVRHPREKGKGPSLTTLIKFCLCGNIHIWRRQIVFGYFWPTSLHGFWYLTSDFSRHFLSP